jgi:hypothetical protein
MKKHIKILALVFGLIPLYFYSQQGNYKYNNFGNRSILLSGNVTGSVSDIGLVFYNPSRLTELSKNGFAFNAEAFQLSTLRLTVLEEETLLNNTSFGGVPSMAGGTVKLFGEHFAYSFISRRKTDIGLSTNSKDITKNILDIFPDTQNYNFKAALNNKIKDNWYGLTWAKKLSEQLSIGISVFGSLFKYESSSDLSHTIKYNEEEQEEVAYYLMHEAFKQTSCGFNIKIGATYKIKNIDLGINLNVPYLELYSDGEFCYNQITSGVGNGFDTFYDYNYKKLTSKKKEPLGISIGTGIPLKKSKIHLNIDFVSGLSNYQRISISEIDIGAATPTAVIFNEARKAVFNFGIGGEIFLNDKFTTYFGFSSDFNAFKSNELLFNLTTSNANDMFVGTDFFHYSGGINMEMNWASIVMGITYASGSSKIQNPFRLNLSGIDFTDTQNSMLSSERWQFIVGLEIPFLNNKIKA